MARSLVDLTGMQRYKQEDYFDETDAHTFHNARRDGELLRFAVGFLWAAVGRYEDARRADEIHWSRLLRRHQLSRQRQTHRREPHSPDRILHLDFERQAQPCLSGADRRCRRTHGPHFEIGHEGRRLAEMPRLSCALYETGTTRSQIRNRRRCFLRKLSRPRFRLAWSAHHNRLATRKIHPTRHA